MPSKTHRTSHLATVEDAGSRYPPRIWSDSLVNGVKGPDDHRKAGTSGEERVRGWWILLGAANDHLSVVEEKAGEEYQAAVKTDSVEACTKSTHRR